MASYTLSPIGGAGSQFFDNSGNVLSGGKLYTYAAGTTTPQTTWTTPAGTIANSNPIVFNSAGRPANEIWLSRAYSYKFVLKDSNDVLIATYDNIPGLPQPAIVNDASSISYEPNILVTAGSFVIGQTYMIASLGTTDFTAIGAGYNSTGIIFTASGAGTGTGTAYVSTTVEARLRAYEASGGSDYIGFLQFGTGALTTETVQDKLRQTVNVEDFGAVGDGVTDDQPAIARALDSLTTNGGVLEFENGKTYYVSQPIILPYNSDPSRYLRLQGNGAKLKGTMSTNIIETGQTITSVGGVSNWNTVPESYLHGNIHISGLLFEDYAVAVRLYNAVFNSSVVDNYFMEGKTAIQAKRSFYTTITQNTIRNGYAGKPDAETAVILEEFVNIIYFNDNHISGTTGGGPTGTGLSISDGGYAFTLAECGIEGCKVGVTLSGENNPLDITGCYFEANEKSIVHTGGTLFGTASGNWFYDPITFESSGSPSMKFVNNTNFNNGTITATVNTAFLTWDQGDAPVSQTNVISNLARPAWLNTSFMSKQLTGGERIVYNAVIGFDGAAAKATVQYQDMLMPFNYFGDIFREVGVPFCATSINGGATEIYFDTRIVYRAGRLGGIEYDLTVNDFGSSTVLAGRVLNDGSVVPYDSTGKTVVVSDNGGFVRITVSTFNFSGGFSAIGRIRAV